MSALGATPISDASSLEYPVGYQAHQEEGTKVSSGLCNDALTLNAAARNSSRMVLEF